MKNCKNERGFTLVEMLIVLFVISILLVITIPNIAKNEATISNKGCDAFVKMVEGQVEAYKLDHGAFPASTAILKTEGYLKETSCPNGNAVIIDSTGKVSATGEDS